MRLELKNEAKTLALGEALGHCMGPGGVVLLHGELAAGKTALARGLARGLGVSEAYVVTSPTFTLVNIYPGRLPFHHADLYRLEEGDVWDLGLLEEAAAGVLAVEWAERAPDAWPEDAVKVSLTVLGPEEREALVEGPDELLARLEQEMNLEA